MHAYSLAAHNVDHGSNRFSMANSGYLCCLMHLGCCVFLSAQLTRHMYIFHLQMLESHANIYPFDFAVRSEQGLRE